MKVVLMILVIILMLMTVSGFVCSMAKQRVEERYCSLAVGAVSTMLILVIIKVWSML